MKLPLAIGIVAPLISGLEAARIQTALHVHESLRTQLLRNADWRRLAALHAEEKAAENAAVFSSGYEPQSHLNVTKFGGISGKQQRVFCCCHTMPKQISAFSVFAGLGSPRQSLRLLVKERASNSCKTLGRKLEQNVQLIASGPFFLTKMPLTPTLAASKRHFCSEAVFLLINYTCLLIYVRVYCIL